jgi:hypothetical protein
LALKSTTYFRLARASMVAAAFALTAGQATAQQVNQPGFLGDVIGQFNELSVRPDPMGWDIGKALDPAMPDPSLLHPERSQRGRPHRLLRTP